MSFVLDWRSNHLLSPLWHPHARFHAAILLFFFAGVGGIAIAIKAAAFLSASYWTPFFFVPFLLRRFPLVGGIPGHEPRIAGIIVYPNLVVVGICLLVTLYALRLGTRAQRPRFPNRTIIPSNNSRVARRVNSSVAFRPSGRFPLIASFAIPCTSDQAVHASGNGSPAARSPDT